MKQPLVIQIKKPCHENWDEMTQVEQEKFCSRCQKTVIDFSERTDAALYSYFSNNENFCGRFKNTQIDRIIEEPKPVIKRLFHCYSKVVAFILTLCSFKNFQATAQTNKVKIENFIQSADEIHQAKMTIEGTIKDDENRLVDSVDIYFDNIKVTTSNHLGYYIFEVEKIALKNHIISFSKNQYRSTAISFHPLMGNTKHDVEMCNYKEKECYSMGVPVRPHFKFSSINFLYKKQINEIHKELNDFAIKLRENPWSEVRMTLYFAKETNKKLCEQKGQEIIDYLVDKQGIDRERLHLKVTKNPKKTNIVEVVDYHQ